MPTISARALVELPRGGREVASTHPLEVDDEDHAVGLRGDRGRVGPSRSPGRCRRARSRRAPCRSANRSRSRSRASGLVASAGSSATVRSRTPGLQRGLRDVRGVGRRTAPPADPRTSGACTAFQRRRVDSETSSPLGLERPRGAARVAVAQRELGQRRPRSPRRCRRDARWRGGGSSDGSVGAPRRRHPVGGLVERVQVTILLGLADVVVDDHDLGAAGAQRAGEPAADRASCPRRPWCS